jgi:NAD(P)-dependent dehydrogenase (short-subunit alcohol dehydrogenase family)
VSSGLAGRRALVTGGSAGLGWSSAAALAAEGAEVTIVSRSAARLEVAAERIRATTPEAVLHTVVADVADSAAVASMVETAEAAMGGVDILVANAGGPPPGDFASTALEAYEPALRLNLLSTVAMCRAVVPVMIAGGGGSIVNVSSGAGLRGSASGVAYASSKHAVHGLTRNMSVMYSRDNIRTNAVAPGGVATNIEAPFRSTHAREVIGGIMKHVVPGWATAEEVAAMICWVLSDEASNVNGAILSCDGGWSAI